MTGRARLASEGELRGQLLEAFASINQGLDFISTNLGRVAGGDHRDRVKAARRVMRTLRSPLG